MSPKLQKADRQGKGVGARLYNVPEALGGTQENPDTVIAYAIALDRNDILDIRKRWHRSKLGQAYMLGRHAFRLAEASLVGGEHMTDRLHESFRRRNPTAKVVIQEFPPRSAMRRTIRGITPNPILDPSFLVVRDPELTIQRVGTYTRPQ